MRMMKMVEKCAADYFEGDGGGEADTHKRHSVVVVVVDVWCSV